MTTAKPPARYSAMGSARAGDFATAELHHRLGHDPRGAKTVPQKEIDAIRAMLAAKPRPVGWAERRARLDEVGSVWPVADDIGCEPVDCGGVPGEWSLPRLYAFS